MPVMCANVVFLLAFISTAFGNPLAVPQAVPMSEYDHQPTSTWAPSSTSAPHTETTGGVSDTTKAAMAGLLLLFIIAIAAFTCVGYSKIRNWWAMRLRGRPWGGLATGPGPPGASPTIPNFPYQPIVPPAAHTANPNGHNAPLEMVDLRPIPVIVAPRFG